MKLVYLLIFTSFAESTLFAQNVFPSTGNVGIGTSAPIFNLDIWNSGNATFRVGSSANTGYSDITLGKTNSWKISKQPGAVGESGSLAITYNTNVYGGDRPVLKLNHSLGSWDAQFGTSDRTIFGGVNLAVYGSIGAQRMILSTTTNISNMFTGADYVLIANGKIGAREIIVSLATPFPDYVFNPEYKLLSLSEIESHIKQHSRLPEMPSAEQVEKDGLEISKTTVLLVQKIEELTLHMIEMDKKIKILEEENAKLKQH